MIRRLVTREAREKRERRNKLFMALFFIAVLGFSTVGFAFNNNIGGGVDLDKVSYNGVNFAQEDTLYWRSEINGNSLLTEYNPFETEDILVNDFRSLNGYVNEPLYLVGGYSVGNSEIARNLQSVAQRIQEACIIDNDDCPEEFPIKSCSEDNIIIFEEIIGSENGIMLVDKCIIITANLGEQSRYADALLFKIFRVN